MKLKYLLCMASMLCVTKLAAQPFGSWDFNSSNLVATAGSDLAYADGSGGSTASKTVFGATTQLGIPDIAGSPAIVLKFPAATNGEGYLMPTPSANGGGSTVNEYTYILDVFYPSAAVGTTRPLIQTEDGTHLGGAQQFIVVDGESGGVGPASIGSGAANGPYVGSLQPNTWYRLAIVVQAGGTIRVYTNGVEMGSFSGGDLDGFFALNPNAMALILANTSQAAAAGYANSIQLRDVALNAGQIAALGTVSAAGIPTIIPPVPSFIAARNPGVDATGVSEEPAISVVLNQGDTTVTSGSVHLYLDGAPVGTVTETPPTFTVNYTVPPRFDPLSTHYLKLTWNDSVAGNNTNSWGFTVKNYQVVNLPAPFYFENFDSLTENATPGVALPAGWTVHDQTASDNPGNDLDDRDSDTYKGWILVSSARFYTWDADRTNLPTIILNGSKLTTLTSGNLLWTESDKRCGGCNGQFADLFPAPINCTGKSNVFVAFNSIYEQNQDNMDFMEYSVDGGSTWLPVLYYFDNDPANSDIVTNAGVVNVPATFARVDVNRNWSPDTTPVHATNYGSYISAQVSSIKASDIKGRLNDDTFDGKRIEVIRLPAADGQASVRFRLNANGTSSWFWGIDNFGLYEITTPVFTAQPNSQNVAAGTTAQFTVAVSSPTPVTYQWQRAGTNIYDGGRVSGVTNATLTIVNAVAGDADSYRCKVSNSSGPVTSNPANLTVVTVPVMTTDPLSVVVSDGYPASFNGAAFGGVPVSYEWRLNGVAIGNGTSYNMASAHAATAGDYTLVANNSYGSVTSRVARLTVVDVPVTNSLVVHLKFDGDYTDATGRGNNGTPVHGPGLVSGKLGSALQFTTARGLFPAETNYVTLNYPSDLMFTDNVNFSISFWVKLTSQNVDLALFGNTQWDSSNNRGWGIFCQDGGNFRVKATTGSGGSGNKTDVTYQNIIRDGTWHHLVVAFEQGYAIYAVLDGQKLTPKIWTATASGTVDTDTLGYTRTINVPPNTDFTGNLAVNIGQEGTGWYNDKDGGAITNGLIDDVGIWRRALSTQEAQAIYTAGMAGHDLSQAVRPASAGILSITQSGAMASFNWVGGPSVKLQQTIGLTPPDWQDVAGTLGASSAMVPLTNRQAFFRLAQ
jgi:hypothetical protein